MGSLWHHTNLHYKNAPFRAFSQMPAKGVLGGLSHPFFGCVIDAVSPVRTKKSIQTWRARRDELVISEQDAICMIHYPHLDFMIASIWPDTLLRRGRFRGLRLASVARENRSVIICQGPWKTCAWKQMSVCLCDCVYVSVYVCVRVCVYIQIIYPNAMPCESSAKCVKWAVHVNFHISFLQENIRRSVVLCAQSFVVL